MDSAWHWIAENRKWLFSGVGITALGIIWRLLWKAAPKATARSDSPSPHFNVNISPSISPTISTTQLNGSVLWPHLPTGPDAPRPPTPNVGSLRPEIARATYDGETDVWSKSNAQDAVPAALLPFSNEPQPPLKTASIEELRARLTYYNRDHIEEFMRVDSGCWIDEAYRSIDIHVGDIVYLIAAIQINGHAVVVVNPRYSSNRYSENHTIIDHLPPGAYELKVDLFGGEHGDYTETYWYSLEVGEQLLVKRINQRPSTLGR